MFQFSDDWYLVGTSPDKFLTPSDFIDESLRWLSATVPGTVALSLLNSGQWKPNDQFDFDSQDYWYKKEFDLEQPADQSPLFLCFDGLATLCEVWLNGQRILESNSMFLGHQIDISEYIQTQNELYLCFRSLNKALSQRRPRPRWKTKLVSQQQLRWFRTTLLGRIPGWTPAIAPVGPWKEISLSESLTPLNVDISLFLEGTDGVVDFSCDVFHRGEVPIEAVLSIGDTDTKLNLEKIEQGSRVHRKFRINEVALWWPHTHGEPILYPVKLSIKVAEEERSHPLPPIGFKKVHVEQSNDEFCITVNNTKIFCRGACWTVNEIVSLLGNSSSLEQTLILMRNAGTNMIRVGGTMLYEQEGFYQLCDKLGIMVWQDFMFANMDYPVNDEAFALSIRTEAEQQLVRLHKYVCLSVYCGNSEIEQQAAMLGIDSESWSNGFFSKQLPKLCKNYHPNIPYITSTPTGDVLPFHTDTGVSHYYGVGAYLRPINEVRQHSVKFSPECLGFSNIPVAKTRNSVLDRQIPVTHHPLWKERVPRDTGTGWDFEDVRDHYMRALFDVDPVQLRSFDNEKYLTLSEIVSGEMMSQVFAEWRSCHSHCSGGLVWFLKDFWPGAGWGIIDSCGLPKAAYYYLKRCWQPVAVCITDESLNGLHIHVNNETKKNFSGELEVTLLNEFGSAIASVTTKLVVLSRNKALILLDQLLNTFYDTTYTYRFGPSKHSVVSVRLIDPTGHEVSTAYYFPNRELPRFEEKPNLKAVMTASNDNAFQLELSCDKFLYAVNIDTPGFSSSDNYFHMIPGVHKLIKIERLGDCNKMAKGYISAVNMSEDVKIKVSSN